MVNIPRLTGAPTELIRLRGNSLNGIRRRNQLGEFPVISWVDFILMIWRQLVPCLAVMCLAGRAHADGAFPDEYSVYLPSNAPHRIILGTNFGLVVSEDDGQSWRYVCELYITNNVNDQVNFYKLAADGAVFAISY